MAKIIGSPTRYIQGKGELRELLNHASTMGKRILILTDKNVKQIVMPRIKAGEVEKDVCCQITDFGGECCMTEINRVKKIIEEDQMEVIVGIGGGKTHDTAKAAGYYTHIKTVIVPTIASTDAPCSSLSVIYTENGVFEKYLYLPYSPNMVLVDTEVVSQAPARLLAAGIGDAMATYFEARACERSNADNCLGGKTTKAALTLARLCYDTLLEDGIPAMLAVKNKVCTKAVENIIEANTYLSGVGFESGGLAAAHAIHNGLTAIPETHQFYHGEKVAFGTIVQLVLENAPQQEVSEVLNLCRESGLPMSFVDLNIKASDTAGLMRAAELSCADGDTMGNMPFVVTPDDVYAAMLAADELGKCFKRK